MKKALSICIFCVILFMGFWSVWNILSLKEESKELESEKRVENSSKGFKQNENIPSSVETNKEVTYYKYMIYQDGERLTVYESDSLTVFMETDILVDELPEDMREQLKLGVGISTEEELYDFLESYSS